MKKILLLILLFGIMINLNSAETIKGLTEACDNGDGQKCNSLGVMYVDGKGVKQDDVKATKFYKKACDSGYAMGCGNLGFQYANGLGVEKNKIKAFNLYAKGCDGGVAMLCGLLGMQYDKEGATKKDIVKAIKYYQKACDSGEGMSCDTLGVYYLGGFKVKKNRAKAIKLFGKACAFGNKNGCEQYADFCDNGDSQICYNLGILYTLKKNELKAVDFFTKACDGGHEDGCSMIKKKKDLHKNDTDSQIKAWSPGEPIGDFDTGNVYYDNPLELAKKYSNNCQKGKIAECVNLGYMYFIGDKIKQDYTKAKELFEKVCNSKESYGVSGCSNLGFMYSEGKGVKQDYKKAIEYYAKSCDGNIAMGCHNLANMYFRAKGTEQNITRAVELFSKACDGGYEDGCKNKEIIEKEKKKILNKRVIEELQKACDGGDAYMCLSIGSMYQDGERVNQDYEKAKVYYKKACDAGYKYGCDYLHTVQELSREKARTEAVNKMNSIPGDKIDDLIKKKDINSVAQSFVKGMNRKIKSAGESYKTDEITTQQYSTLEDDTIIMNFTINKAAFSKYYLPEYPNLSTATEANIFLLEEINRKRFCSVNSMRSMMKNGIAFSFLYKFDDGTSLPPKKIVYSDCTVVDNYEKHLKMCRKDNAFMCDVIGNFYESGSVVKPNHKRSAYFYRKGCDYNYVNACTNLGAMYFVGNSAMDKDYALANTLLERACLDGSSQACTLLFSMYYNGKGVEKNIHKAKEFIKKSCDLGQKEGCDIYKKITN